MDKNERKRYKHQRYRDSFKKRREKIEADMIEDFIEKHGTEPNEEEKSDIRKKASRSAHDEIRKSKIYFYMVLPIALTAGIGLGIKSNNDIKMLTSGNVDKFAEEVVKANDDRVENLEDEKTVNAITQTAVDKFKSELQDMSNYHYQSNIRQEIKKDIESIDKEEEALKYLKEFFAKQYNESNFTDVKAEDIIISKSTVGNVGNVLYRDVAENGEEIIRKTTKSEAEHRGLSTIIDAQMISVYINGHSSETATFAHNKYVPVYSDREEVDSNETNTLCKIGDIMQSGIRWAETVEQDMDGLKKWKIQLTFMNQVTDYELSKDRRDDSKVMTAEDKVDRFNIEDERE